MGTPNSQCPSILPQLCFVMWIEFRLKSSLGPVLSHSQRPSAAAQTLQVHKHVDEEPETLCWMPRDCCCHTALHSKLYVRVNLDWFALQGASLPSARGMATIISVCARNPLALKNLE